VSDSERRRDFRGRRWLVVLLRGMHLVVVIWLGAVLLGAPEIVGGYRPTAWVFGTGMAMFVLDLWHRPQHLRQWAGVGVLLKLALIAWMMLAPNHGLVLFWLVVVWSAIFSHAPAAFRNAPVFGN
jgi:hypothetical protein